MKTLQNHRWKKTVLLATIVPSLLWGWSYQTHKNNAEGGIELLNNSDYWSWSRVRTLYNHADEIIDHANDPDQYDLCNTGATGIIPTYQVHFYDVDEGSAFISTTSCGTRYEANARTRVSKNFTSALDGISNGTWDGIMSDLGSLTHFLADLGNPHHATNGYAYAGVFTDVLINAWDRIGYGIHHSEFEAYFEDGDKPLSLFDYPTYPDGLFFWLTDPDDFKGDSFDSPWTTLNNIEMLAYQEAYDSKKNTLPYTMDNILPELGNNDRSDYADWETAGKRGMYSSQFHIAMGLYNMLKAMDCTTVENGYPYGKEADANSYSAASYYPQYYRQIVGGIDADYTADYYKIALLPGQGITVVLDDNFELSGNKILPTLALLDENGAELDNSGTLTTSATVSYLNTTANSQALIIEAGYIPEVSVSSSALDGTPYTLNLHYTFASDTLNEVEGSDGNINSVFTGIRQIEGNLKSAEDSDSFDAIILPGATLKYRFAENQTGLGIVLKECSNQKPSYPSLNQNDPFHLEASSGYFSYTNDTGMTVRKWLGVFSDGHYAGDYKIELKQVLELDENSYTSMDKARYVGDYIDEVSNTLTQTYEHSWYKVKVDPYQYLSFILISPENATYPVHIYDENGLEVTNVVTKEEGRAFMAYVQNSSDSVRYWNISISSENSYDSKNPFLLLLHHDFAAEMLVQEDSGSSSSSSSTTNVSPAINSITPSTTTGTAPATISFSASAQDSDGSISLYSWSFGDGVKASGQSVSHTYYNAGTYTATLTVTDNMGATATAQTTVTISESFRGIDKIVLTWDNDAYSYAPDFDAYLTGPATTSVSNSEDQTSENGRFILSKYTQDLNVENGDIVLDNHSDENAASTEEVIFNGLQKEDGVYRFYVMNESAARCSTWICGSNDDFYQGDVTVKIWKNGSVWKSFTAPEEKGHLWKVFELTGETITTVNTITDDDDAGNDISFSGNIPEYLRKLDTKAQQSE